MRLTCSQKDLAHALSITNQAVDLNNTLPVLNNVYLKAEGQKLFLSTTNLEIAIHYWIAADVKNEGEITIPSKLFTSYINYLKDDSVDLRIEEDTLLVQSKVSKTKLKGIPASEFPKIPAVEREGGFKIDSADLAKAINQVSLAASLNTTRPVLSGVYFTGNKKDEIRLVATDSYRLAEKVIKSSHSNTTPSCIVPIKTIHHLGFILSSLKNEPQVLVTISSNQILFSIGEVHITSRLIEGEFPNYQQIIPKSFKTKAHLTVSDLILSLKRINLFAKENNNKIILHFLKTGLRITTDTTQYGEEEVTLGGTIDGEENEIALNSQYLLDALANLGSAEVTLGVENKTNPALLQPTQDKHYTYIVMPLKM